MAENPGSDNTGSDNTGSDNTGSDNTVRRFLLVGALIPVVLAGLGVAVQVWALPDVPDPIAVHWGFGGEPDGFGSPTTSLWLTAVLGLGLPLLLTGSALPGLRRGDRGVSYRFLGANAAGLSAFLVYLATMMLLVQRGLDDARDVGPVWSVVALSMLSGLVVGWLGWRLQPDVPWRNATLTDVEPADLGLDGTWSREVVMSRVGLWLLVSLTLLTAAFTVGAWVAAPDPAAFWALGGATVLLLVTLLTTAAFHVRVDEGGLSVRSVVGVPWFTVPIDEVERVGVAEVSPVGEFGGWGLRWTPGRVGVVLRTGEAIVVSRRTKSQFTVTVDDAATGAALLEAYRGRHE